MRRLDRLAGVPLCMALTGVRRVVDRVREPAPLPRRVLVIHLSEMGATVLALPALNWLRRRLPGVELHFLAFSATAEAVQALRLAPRERILLLDPATPATLTRTLALALARARRLGIDGVLDFETFSRFSASVGYLACPTGRRCGFHPYNVRGLYRGDLLTHPVLYSPHLPAAKAYLALVRALVQDPSGDLLLREPVSDEELVLPDFAPDAEDAARLDARLQDLGISRANPLLLLNPNSSDLVPQRRWPLERFGEVGRRLLADRPDWRVLVTGTAGEAAGARQLLHAIDDPRVVDFTGRTPLGELLALHARASLLVTNDSGPAHLAALMRLPTVVLFGPETPRLFAPLGDRCVTLYRELACSPCVTAYNAKESPCRHNVCLLSIDVDSVVRAAEGLLNPGVTTRGGAGAIMPS